MFSVLGFFFYVAGGALLIDRYNNQIYDDQSGSVFDSLAAKGLAAGALMVLQGLLMLVEAVFGTIAACKN